MRTFIIISPHYLESIYKEAKKYDFLLQGYGDSATASKRLIYTPISSLQGFAYVADEIIDPGALGKFLHQANLLGSKRKFLFYLKDISDLSLLLQEEKYENLDIYYNTFSELTDIDVNRGIFGSLLINITQPYRYTETSFEPIPVFEGRNLRYQPIIHENYSKILSRFNAECDLEETLARDEVLMQLKREGSFLAKIREYRIARNYLIDCSAEPLLEEIENLDVDINTKNLYTAVISIIDR